MDSVHDDRVGVEPITGLCRFRDGFYSCLGARADAQFELTEALLCADGPVRSLVDLSLAPEHRRGHGALYDGLNHGSIEIARLRRGVAGYRYRGSGTGSCWPPTSRRGCVRTPRPARTAVLPRPRPGQGQRPDDPGLAVLGRGRVGSGRSSWTAVLDAVRLGPADDATAVTAAQLREVVDRLRAVGHWRPGDPTIWIVLDSGYDVTRLAFLLADLPVMLIGRLRSDRVLARPVEPRRPGAIPGAAHAAMARSWSWPTRPPGPPPSTPAAPRPPATAPRKPAPGIAAIPGWNTAAPGATTPASCRSSKAP